MQCLFLAEADIRPLDGNSRFVLCALCFVLCALCRFSDAGNDDLTTRCGGRRPKSAKARNRGRVRSVGRAARSAMGI